MAARTAPGDQRRHRSGPEPSRPRRARSPRGAAVVPAAQPGGPRPRARGRRPRRRGLRDLARRLHRACRGGPARHRGAPRAPRRRAAVTPWRSSCAAGRGGGGGRGGGRPGRDLHVRWSNHHVDRRRRRAEAVEGDAGLHLGHDERLCSLGAGVVEPGDGHRRPCGHEVLHRPSQGRTRRRRRVRLPRVDDRPPRSPGQRTATGRHGHATRGAGTQGPRSGARARAALPRGARVLGDQRAVEQGPRGREGPARSDRRAATSRRLAHPRPGEPDAAPGAARSRVVRPRLDGVAHVHVVPRRRRRLTAG